MNISRRALPALLATPWLSAAWPLWAKQRPNYHALLIGNADYLGRSRDLLNPVRDATLMANTLTELGFAVTVRNNLNRQQMREAIEQFGLSLPKDAVALFYFAGHGVQIRGKNYLLPIDTPMDREQAVPIHGYALSALMEHLSLSPSALNLVVMDACRNNPFEPEKPVRYRNWSVEGWAPVQAPRGSLIAYSTAPGELAADGTGQNSLYTQALAKALKQPGLPIEVVFKRVGEQVRKQTNDDQIPWFESSINQEFFLLPPPGVVVDPRRPSADVKVASVNSRTIGLAPQWFDQLSGVEWNQLDWEIAQRVRHFTPDELPLMERRAKAGNVLAMTTLGLVYREGVNKSTIPGGKTARSGGNNTLAVQWLTKAADAGFAIAMNELGEMLYMGRGLDRNLTEATALFEAASQTGYTRARLNLAQARLGNNPRPEDMGKAMTDILDAITKGMNPAGQGR
jgi:TPR repeat protein